MRFSAALIAIPCALIVFACASPGEEREAGVAAYADDPRLGEAVDRVCFGRQINGFGETTDRTIIVRYAVNEHYLIETVGFCPDLDWAQSIALDQFSSCLTRGDSIIPYGSAFGPRRSGPPPRSCLIKAIYEWDEDAGEQG
jgi:hypothetical protein